MPEVYEDVAKAPASGIENSEVVRKLLEYTDEKHNPRRKDYLKRIEQCYNFKELNQWTGAEKSVLQKLDVPEITPDRINRALENLDGIKANANLKYTVVKKEQGDEAIAEILKKQIDFVIYNSEFEQTKEEAWDNLKDVGIGVRKFGWDDSLMSGEGMLWFESVNIEDCGWSYTRKKNWSDVRWIWQKMTMDWQDAIRLSPEKAPQFNSLKQTLVKTWDEMKEPTTSTGRDYSGDSANGTSSYAYPENVTIWEVWIKRSIPFKTVRFQQETVIGSDPMGMPITAPVTNAKKVPVDYEMQDGEQEHRQGVDEKWYQHLVASGQDKSGAFLLTPPDGVLFEFDFPPFVPMVMEYKKDGTPRGLIEKAIPHQIRINVALAQQTAFNNKAIKSGMIVQTTDGNFDIANAEKQSQFGGIFVIDGNTKIIDMNVTPNVNIQAMNEMNMAKQDMEFAIASTEPAIRGVADAGSSGIKVAQLQSAAVTPLNKWIHTLRDSDELLLRRVLKIITVKFTPDRITRIIGQQRMMQLLPQLMGALPQASMDAYDVEIQDESISNMDKQQSFNASMAIHQGVAPLDPEYIIKNAPIKNPDDAINAYQKQKMDIMNSLVMENNLLKKELGIKNKGGGGQASNAQKGKNQPQAGQQSMLGGQLFANGIL